ncbi:alpha/beta fold hydrolase [Sneathiella aquimaris]|uniref:alpha/beta fold hydrolase n=1 Tax=Sneathiella aquimaris TaxID=2599305 RepID=UPI001469AEFD|nr:alpha/beta hydrolase [Sneathiella aquimaris]
MIWQTKSSLVFEVDGVSLEGRCFGPPPDDAPTIFLLHEGLGCVDLWRDFPLRLVKSLGFGVFAYSRQGYGRSDPIRLPRALDYMNIEAKVSLPKVISFVGARRYVVIGHSDGASIAAAYAGECAGQGLAGIVLIAPHFFAEDISVKSIRLIKEAFEQGGLKDRLAKYHSDIDGAFYGWCDAWLDPAFLNWQILSSVRTIAVPALMIQGAQDEYGTCRQVEAFERELSGDGTVFMLPDCGHSPHLEMSEDVVHAIKNFIQDNRIGL